MKGNKESYLALFMGVIIAIVDIIWIYQSYYLTIWLVEGIIILIADVVWLYVDYDFMTKGKK